MQTNGCPKALTHSAVHEHGLHEDPHSGRYCYQHKWSGRALDSIFVERLRRSVKHEDVYLNGYATIAELIVGLTPLLHLLQR